MLKISFLGQHKESVMGCPYIDSTVFPLTDTAQLAIETIVLKIMCALVAVIADQSFVLSD